MPLPAFAAALAPSLSGAATSGGFMSALGGLGGLGGGGGGAAPVAPDEVITTFDNDIHFGGFNAPDVPPLPGTGSINTLVGGLDQTGKTLLAGSIILLLGAIVLKAAK